jgi:tetratricopeptide (TPR) repeat protein
MNRISLFVAAALIGAAAPSYADNYCGELTAGYGPYDYRERSSGKLEIVEQHHFNKDVENGIRGQSSVLGDDLNYTLVAIPNHHRALATIANVTIRLKTLQLEGAKYPTECYFERAIRFAPNDGVVRATYGNYLNSRGQSDKALAMFETAIELEPDNATINYNVGLLYLKAKNYDKAAEYADKAYALGFPLPGLKNQLAAARKGTQSSK